MPEGGQRQLLPVQEPGWRHLLAKAHGRQWLTALRLLLGMEDGLGYRSQSQARLEQVQRQACCDQLGSQKQMSCHLGGQAYHHSQLGLAGYGHGL